MTDPSPLGEAPHLNRPDDWLNQVCAALGLFDGARPVSPQMVLWQEVLPTIAALKANNPEAGILVEENRRVQQLWRDALARMVDANRRADGFLQRWHEVEAERKLLKQQILVAEGAARRDTSLEVLRHQIEDLARYYSGTADEVCVVLADVLELLRAPDA